MSDITNFITWFIGQTIGIGGTAFNYIDQIVLNQTYGITLLDFIIYIIIITAVLKIITTQAISNRIAREGRKKDVQK